MKGNQSVAMSFVEAVVNTLVGLLAASAIQMAICVYYNIPMSWNDNLIIVAWMTVFSVVRSFLLRRAFNSEIWRRWRHGKTDHT